MLALFSAVLAAPPTSAAQVDALLKQLIAEKPEARIAAANSLMKTPRELMRQLKAETIEPTCSEKIGMDELTNLPVVCQRWNQAMYHYTRVIGALARDSTNPNTALGAWCLPRTQPPLSGTDEPACPMVSELRWLLDDPFQVDFIDFGDEPPAFVIPEAASAKTLKMAVRASYLEALRPTIDKANLERFTAWSASEGKRSVHLVPICGGRPGFYERCAYHLVVSEPGRFQRTIFMPAIDRKDADPGTPYTNVRMTSVHLHLAGDHAMVATDGGSGGDFTRRFHVYTVSGTPKPVCELNTEPPGVEDNGHVYPPVVWPKITPQGCSL